MNQPFFRKVQARKSSAPNKSNSSVGLFNLMNDSVQDTSDEFLHCFGIPQEDHQKSYEAFVRDGISTESSQSDTNQDEQHETNTQTNDEENTNPPPSHSTHRVRSSHSRSPYGIKTVKKPASSSSDKGAKRKRNQKWLSEIRKYQKSTKKLIPQASFIRLVKQVTIELMEKEPMCRTYFGENGIPRWKKPALADLHHAAEDYLYDLLSKSYHATLHAKRVTIMGRDLKLVQNINTEHRRHSNLTETKKQASFQERPKRKNPNPSKRNDHSETTGGEESS